MTHLLDNPVWNALVSGNSILANGDEQVKYFPETVAPFVGLQTVNDGCFAALYQLIPAARTIAIVTPGQIDIPAQWQIVHHTQLPQMVFDNSNELPPAGTQALEVLSQHHVPAMIALTKMTNPGPFYERTLEFGNYYGIFHKGQLAAMAGQRMHAGPYIEISAVCTHPDYHGKGYATALIGQLIKLIRAQGGIPFLHVRADNNKAIALYRALGFLTRHEMTINILKKKG